MTTDRDQTSRDVTQDKGMPQQKEPTTLSAEGQHAYSGLHLLGERDRQRQQLGTELRQLNDQIEASEGYRFYNRMTLLEKSYFIFDVNRLSLEHSLNEFEQPMGF